jgi:hypothetical protein
MHRRLSSLTCIFQPGLQKRSYHTKSMLITVASFCAQSPAQRLEPRLSSPHSQSYSHPTGVIIGVSIFVVLTLALVLRYAYLASPFWLVRLKRWMGLCPSDRTPISHLPLGLSKRPQASNPVQPEPAHTRVRKLDPLPPYLPTSRFSSDVLDALESLEKVSITRPPSYRSRLSVELRMVIERASDSEGGKSEQNTEGPWC